MDSWAACATDFTLSYGVDCSLDTLTIDSTKFSDPAFTYDIASPEASFEWTDSAVTSALGFSNECGSYSWQVFQSDGVTPLDSSIYTVGDLTLATKTIAVFTDQMSYAGLAAAEDAVVKVSYAAYPSVASTQAFSFELRDSCATGVLVTPQSAIPDQVYTVGDPQIDVSYDVFTFSPSYCTMTASFLVSPSTAAVSLDEPSQLVSIQTTDVDLGIDFSLSPPAPPQSYTVTVFLVTHTGVQMDAANEVAQFQVEITDPCFSATIDLSTGVVPDLAPVYTIGAAADDVQLFAFASADYGLALTCPALQFSLAYADGNALDASIFTFSSAEQKLTTSSSDRGAAGTYTLRLTAAFTGSHYTNPGFVDFTMTLVDPCPTSSMTLDQSPWPTADQTSLLADATEVVWNTVSLYTLDVNVDCGSYSLTVQQKASGDASFGPLDPLLFSFDSAAEKLVKASTTDTSLADVYEIAFTVSLTEYPSVTSALSAPFSYTVGDPCLAPTISVPAQSDPAEYKYTASAPQAEFTVVPFVVTPADCLTTYTCLTTGGPASFADLCAISAGSTVGNFNASTLVWSFSSTDVVGVPEGTYQITITATTGTNSDQTLSHDFTLLLTNPCPTATLSLSASSPFTDSVYSVGEALI